MNLKRKPSEKAKPKKPVIKKNVSERNRGQEQLRASEEKFRLLFKAVPVPIFTWQRVDDDFILIDHNDSAKSFTHGTITNFIGIKAKDMYRGNAQILKDLDQCLQSKSTVERDMNYQLISSGEQKYLHVKYAFVPPDLIMVHTDDFTEQRRIETALRENEQDLRILFETMSEGIALNEIIYNENSEMVDYRILNANLAFYSMANHGGGNVIGNVATKLYDMSPESIKEFWKLHKEKNSTTYTEIFSPIDKRWFFVATSPFVHNRFVSSFFDITERKQMDKALQESEKRYKQLLDSVTDYLYSVQVQNGRPASTVHGPGCIGVTGYMPADYEADPGLWYRMVYESDREKVTAQAARVLAGESAPPLEHRILHQNGSIRWVKNTCVPHHDQQRNLIAYDGLVQDITERKKMEDALKKSEEKYRKLVDLTPNGILIHSNGEIVFANISAATMLGPAKPEDLVGKKLIDFVHPDYRGTVVKRVQQITENKSSVPLIEEKLVRLDGVVIDAEVAAIPFSFAEESGVQVVFREITERKRVEEEIRQLNASLEQRVEKRTQELRDAQEQLVRNEKLAVLGQLAGSVGHELRNPLGVIANAVYFLKLAQPDANEKIKEYLGLIEKHIHISDMIIADLLDFTRVKSVECIPVSITELIHQTLERFPVHETVRVTLNLPDDLPQVYADPQHIIQVLGNLTLNGCQAMPQGGDLIISSQLHDEMIRIALQDTGVGISPENMKKLFEPLFTTKPKGIGLGLAVSRKLIETNSGRIEVQSEPEKGSTFTIWLPVKQ